MKLKGKTVLVTGGAAGIGLEATQQFLANGARVIITGRDQAKLDAAKRAYPAITAIRSDVAVAADAKSLFDQVKALGGIDILYNNAGVMSKPLNLGVANDKHVEVAQYEMDINYIGVIRLNNLFMEMLKSRSEGAIINTSSFLSYVPYGLGPTYAASKAAMHFYTVSLRDHVKIRNSKLKVFELFPPVVATAMTAGLGSKGIAPEKLVNALIAGLKGDRYTIRVGDTKLVYLLSRFAPGIIYGVINTAKDAKLLK